MLPYAKLGYAMLRKIPYFLEYICLESTRFHPKCITKRTLTKASVLRQRPSVGQKIHTPKSPKQGVPSKGPSVKIDRANLFPKQLTAEWF